MGRDAVGQCLKCSGLIPDFFSMQDGTNAGVDPPLVHEDAKEEDAVVPKEEPLTATVASEEPTEVAEAATQPEAPGIPVNAAAATAAPLPAQPTPTAPESDKATAPAAPAKTVGGAAILAKLRAARAAKAKSTDARLPVTVLFASQTGTAREIAQSIGGHCRESLGLEAKARVWGERAHDLPKVAITDEIDLGACPYPPLLYSIVSNAS